MVVQMHGELRGAEPQLKNVGGQMTVKDKCS